MDQEAPNELVRRKRHGFPAARTFDAIVLSAERHATVIGGNEPAIGDGDVLGQYTAGSFAISSDGSAGTFITDPPLEQQAQLTRPHQ